MLANEQGVAALPCIQHILDANRLAWSHVGHHPDCQMASVIHGSQQQEATCDLIIDTRRKCRNWLRLRPPDDFFPEAWTKRCNEHSIFNAGLVANKRTHLTRSCTRISMKIASSMPTREYTLRGLAPVYQFRINLILVASKHHDTKTCNGPRSPRCGGEMWLILLNFQGYRQ
jgi:hypothetical protein